MKLHLDIKPRTMFVTSVTATDMSAPVRSTQEQLQRKLLKDFYFQNDSYCNWSGSFSTIKTVRAYSLEKRRKKVQIRTIKGKQVRKVISPSYWIATYYDIPYDYLKLAKLKVIQGNRTWKFVSTK